MKKKTLEQKTILILCDKRKIGTLRQCEALAQPLSAYFNADLVYVDVNLPFWCRIFTPYISRHWPIKTIPMHNLPLKDPFLIIAAGRQSFVLASPLAKHIPTIALLNPRCPFDYFKLVIPPQHDGVGEYPNVIETLGSLHPHNEASFLTDINVMDDYIVTVLLGGNSKHYTFKETLTT